MKDKTVRELLFKGFKGCTNHNCVIEKRTGMGTNGSCTCLFNLSRGQLHQLTGRIGAVIDKVVIK